MSEKTKKKSFGKSLLGLFVEVDDSAEDKAQVEKLETIVEEASSTDIPVNMSAGEKDDNIAQSLASSLEDANLSGYDYFEFAKTIDAFKASIPAEQQRYQTAFAGGSVMGATVDNLIKTANHYLDVLKGKKDEFDTAVKLQVKATVTCKEEEASSVEAQIKEKADQICALTEEINTLSSRKGKISNEVSENKIKIEKIQNNFAATYQVFVGRISDDVDKIKKYLSPAKSTDSTKEGV